MITYVLGAGASFNALPIVANIPKEIANVSNEISQWNNLLSGHQARENYQSVHRDLQTLLQGCISHYSIDTYARKYWLKDEMEEYERIKWRITLFFDLYSYLFRKIEKRYDSFLSTIMDKPPQMFPRDFSIISWNYDYEIEKSFLPYTTYKRLEEAYNDIAFHHKGFETTHEGNKMYVIKINGTTGCREIAEEGKKANDITLGLGLNKFSETNKEIDPRELETIYKTYVSLSATRKSTLSFAWERGKDSARVVQLAHDTILESDAIVIIGYSFPYFNRAIDRMVFLPNGNRKPCKVYIQDVPDKVQQRVDEFKSMVVGTRMSNHVSAVPFTDQFFIPAEVIFS